MHSHEEYFVMDREGSIQNSADNQASDAQSSEQTRGAQDADETGELEDDPFLDQVPQSMAEIYKLSNRTRKKYKVQVDRRMHPWSPYCSRRIASVQRTLSVATAAKKSRCLMSLGVQRVMTTQWTRK
jgi:hypothetical protein